VGGWVGVWVYVSLFQTRTRTRNTHTHTKAQVQRAGPEERTYSKSFCSERNPSEGLRDDARGHVDGGERRERREWGRE